MDSCFDPLRMSYFPGTHSRLRARMLLILLLCSLSLSVLGQMGDDEWQDLYDMLNFDPTSRSTKTTSESAQYDNVGTKRREYTEDCDATCGKQVGELLKQIEDQKNTIKQTSPQPTCNPVFKRFLSRLLKEIKRVGMEPSDSTEVFYDAKVKLSKQTIIEIQSLLDGEERWRTGALDNALSQILVDLKQHDRNIWIWRFEDSFGVQLDTVLKIALGVLIIMAIICTEIWSTISWFVQFKRMFAVCFFVSIIWNWFYLYKIAFAEHQNNIVKIDSFNDKCTGMKKIDWSDSLKEWFRSTLTLQDDPCKRYYEVLMVNPILLVPPTKALSVTFTTFFTEPLKHFGQGISEFLRALLKDLPITLQIPVLLTVMLSIVVCLYGSVQAAFRHGIMAPLRGLRRDPPPPGLEQQRHPELEHRRHPELGPPRPPSPPPPPPPAAPAPPSPGNNLPDPYAGGDAPPRRHEPRPQPQRHQDSDYTPPRNQVHRRRPDRTKERPVRRVVETLRTAEPQYSEDETDAMRREESLEAELNLYTASGTEKEPESAGVLEGAADAADNQTEAAVSGASNSKRSPSKENKKDEPNRNDAAAEVQPAEKQPEDPKVQDLGPSSDLSFTPISIQEIGSS